MKNSLFDVSEEIVVITGVCGQLGNAYAREFLNNGARVVGLDINNPDPSNQLFVTGKDKYKYIKADITQKSSLQKSLLEIIDHFGVPTVLINNAGIDSPPSAPPDETGPFEDYPEESWDKVVNVNLKGVYLCCQVFGSAMAINKRGSIVNVSSIYGVVSPDQNLYEYRRSRGEVFFKPVAYSASKSGIINLTRYLAVYWAKKSIRVNSLTLAGVFNNQEREFLEIYCSRIPIGRMADEDEYNGAVIFLASAASQYMTGHNMIVDGGWTAI
tara:strand:+ start:98 stop:907 length:810 start_codon:yes stop_codon:yes gene_type:complete